jgi:dienelactone hydrolase
MTECAIGGLLIAALLASSSVPDTSRGPASEKGVVHFQLADDQKNVPARYRLEAHTFSYEMTQRRDLPNSGLDVLDVRFPSPVTTPCAENNTVYAEYYRPKGEGPFPGVIVLDITAGNQNLSRAIATYLAQNRIAALFVQMAYYGPRRPPGSKLRLLSTNLPQTMDAIRQTVLDVRRATAWLEARPEVDRRRLGIHGTSLGSMVGALCAEMEPKLGRVSIALGGGGLIDAYYDDPRAAAYRRFWEALGGSKDKLIRALAPVDPLTYAANLKDHKVLIIAGKRDEIVPPSATEALWKASGKPKIVWYDCTHYGAALYFVPMLKQVVEHFTAEP